MFLVLAAATTVVIALGPDPPPVRRSLPGPDAGHPLQPAGPIATDGLRRVDSNRDSNSSDQRLAAATGDSA